MDAPGGGNRVQLEATLHAASDGIVVYDAQGRVRFVNAACEQLFGYAAGELLGGDVRLLAAMPPEPGTAVARAGDPNGSALPACGRYQALRGVRKDGSPFAMDATVCEEEDADGERVYAWVIQSARSEAASGPVRREADRMATLGRLTSSVAHDFNNLLTVMIGSAEVLYDILRDRPAERDLCAAVMGVAERGSQLARQLLSFTRDRRPSPGPLDCNRTVSDVVHMVDRLARADVAVTACKAPALPAVYADGGQLHAALLNLVVNALDAMPRGGQVTISTRTVDAEDAADRSRMSQGSGTCVEIAVEDTGQGMEPDVLEQATRALFTTKEHGTGLGLSSARTFAEEAGGAFALESAPGKGTTVRMLLPAAEAATARSGHATEECTAGRSGRGETVLVVEDDELVRQHAVSALESLGYAAMGVATGSEALERLETGERPHVLFSDMVLPGGLCGRELAERARALVPGLRVLLTSGYEMHKRYEASSCAEQPPLLEKPYRVRDLGVQVRQVLDAV